MVIIVFDLYLDVRHAMVVEVRGGCKPFQTNRTLMGLLATVNPSMCV